MYVSYSVLYSAGDWLHKRKQISVPAALRPGKKELFNGLTKIWIPKKHRQMALPEMKVHVSSGVRVAI